MKKRKKKDIIPVDAGFQLEAGAEMDFTLWRVSRPPRDPLLGVKMLK